MPSVQPPTVTLDAGIDSPRIRPVSRELRSDLVKPRFEHLVDLALLRVLDAAEQATASSSTRSSPTQSLPTRPPRLFPTAETLFSQYYTYSDWLTCGDLETELGHMRYMIRNLPERGLPVFCLPHVRLVLASNSVLSAWERVVPLLRDCINGETKWVVQQMQRYKRQQQQQQQQHPAADHATDKDSYITVPTDYRTAPAASAHAARLWEAALSEMELQASAADFSSADAFLHIFAFLKDPLGGLDDVLDDAVVLFAALMASALGDTGTGPVSRGSRVAAIAQAAQEALYLANPLLEHVEYVHFTGHQQLPYVYVALDELPRSEFSIASHVLDIIEEVLNDAVVDNDNDCTTSTTATTKPQRGRCAIAPITVCSYPKLPLGRNQRQTVIIDGNHRATAVMLLRLLAEHPASHSADPAAAHTALSTFADAHGLGAKWRLDLAAVQAALRASARHTALVRARAGVVARFAGVARVPALVVREDSFHTACRQRRGRVGRARLLLPFHQALYNDEGLGFAFPQAGQVHGRAVGFRAMPLL